MKAKNLLSSWRTFTRFEMARMLKKFRQTDNLHKHPTIKHCYQGIAYFDRYDFDCKK